MTQLLSYLATAIIEVAYPFGAKLKATECFIFFHLLQSDMGVEIISWVLNVASSEKSGPTSIPFLFTYIWRQDSTAFKLLNPDWSIEISDVPDIGKKSDLISWFSLTDLLN